MHELSIATSIVSTAEREVKKAAGEKVTEIYLEIGKLAGVEIEALEFVWKPCVQQTVLEQAGLHIREPEGLAECMECGQVFGIDHYYDSCPHCNSPFKKIIQGKELKIKKLIII